MASLPSETPLFQEVLELFSRDEVVKCRNPAEVETLLRKLIEGTVKSLQVITDFDYTLTRESMNGKRCDTCHAVLESMKVLPETVKAKCSELFRKYYPIEICHEMKVSDKIPLMVEWWEESHKVLVSAGVITKSSIHDCCVTSNAQLRENAIEMLRMLNDADVPVLVFSAGIGDILQEILQIQNALLPNMKIVSNWMKFDESGLLTGFNDPIIHVFNKNESVLGTENSSYFTDLTHRNTAILMGDSIGDIQMSDGMPHQGGILKIGFLNVKIEERLESFLDAYDIVILNDQSMDFVILLLKSILKGVKREQKDESLGI